MRKVVLNKKINVTDDSCNYNRFWRWNRKSLKRRIVSKEITTEIICFSKTNDIQLDITDENANFEGTNELKKKILKLIY